MQSQEELTGGVGIDGGGDEQIQQPPLQLHQPQKCPRCDSMNTKFCYYNNYSISQPRYFCKACRRYWTQGGTLRNVPVGGGCRKGKRNRTSGENSRLVPPQQPPEEAVLGQLDFPAAARPLMISTEQVIWANEAGGLGPIGPHYRGGGGAGGYISTLLAIQSLNPSSKAAYNQSMNAGADDVSNLGLSPGFGVSALGSQRQRQPHIRPSRVLYQAEQCMMPSTMVATGSAGVWTHGYGNDANNQRPSDASLWSTMSSASISGNSDCDDNGGSGGGRSSSSIPNLLGYSPPHP